MVKASNTLQGLKDLYARASRENAAPEDVKALHRFYIEHPPQSWRMGIAAIAIEGALDRIGNSAVAESTRAGMRRLRDELGYADAPPLERLVIDHIELCWLNINYTYWLYSQMTARSLSLSEAVYWDKRLSSAQSRYLRSIETLARIRRLKLPTLQLNLAENQVNVVT